MLVRARRSSGFADPHPYPDQCMQIRGGYDGRNVRLPEDVSGDTGLPADRSSPICPDGGLRGTPRRLGRTAPLPLQQSDRARRRIHEDARPPELGRGHARVDGAFGPAPRRCEGRLGADLRAGARIRDLHGGAVAQPVADGRRLRRSGEAHRRRPGQRRCPRACIREPGAGAGERVRLRYGAGYRAPPADPATRRMPRDHGSVPREARHPVRKTVRR